MVILFVKSTYTSEALEINKQLFGEHTLVMTLQNGAGNDRKIAKYVKQENIIIGTTKHNSVNLGSGRIKHKAIGATTIGSKHDAIKNLEIAKNVLEETGFEVVVSEDIQWILWNKLFVNLSVNTLTAITRTKIGYMAENKAAWNFAKRLIYEAVEVAEADGTYFDRREALESVRKVCIDAAEGYSSMYQDVLKGNRTEIDAINGAIVEQAKLYGVPVPYNSLIVDLMHAIEGSYEYNKEVQ
ncbi:2-dehydropantoate 2-reductase [Lachnospiraceae bacterium TWA4]|nr:2-dehydropantoate 2-reductase [Lachnospiraceae bacterium TWA4]